MSQFDVNALQGGDNTLLSWKHIQLLYENERYGVSRESPRLAC